MLGEGPQGSFLPRPCSLPPLPQVGTPRGSVPGHGEPAVPCTAAITAPSPTSAAITTTLDNGSGRPT
jgi:hypothetical protein